MMVCEMVLSLGVHGAMVLLVRRVVCLLCVACACVACVSCDCEVLNMKKLLVDNSIAKLWITLWICG